MKKLTLSEWEEKYILKPVARFDQKYHMFNRPNWDHGVKTLLKDWSFAGEAKTETGYTLQEKALRQASQCGTQVALFNTSKPNPSPVSQAIITAMAGSSSRAGSPPPASAPKQQGLISISPKQITNDIKKAATYFGASLVGICRLDQRWLYSHTYEMGRAGEMRDSDEVIGESKPQDIPEEFQYVIVMGFQEEYDLMKYFPTYISDTPMVMGYSRMAIAGACLSTFIRNLGFKAIDCSLNGVALSIPMAMQAGLGDLGRNGLLITPQYGPRLRLEKVITDLPMAVDAPIDFGVTEFCMACNKCAKLCPSQAITFGERTAESNNVSNADGELKWRINAEKCRIYWTQSNKSCTNCRACCPYNKPYTRVHRTVRWFTDNVRWMNSFYVWADTLFGYGKPVKADNFWQEWQPGRQ
jgi:reductive dehalogenase